MNQGLRPFQNLYRRAHNDLHLHAFAGTGNQKQSLPTHFDGCSNPVDGRVRTWEYQSSNGRSDSEPPKHSESAFACLRLDVPFIFTSPRHWDCVWGFTHQESTIPPCPRAKAAVARTSGARAVRVQPLLHSGTPRHGLMSPKRPKRVACDGDPDDVAVEIIMAGWCLVRKTVEVTGAHRFFH